MTASISHFLTAATKFSCCSSNKKCLLCFLSLALARSSVTIDLSLILLTKRIQTQFPLSVFVFIDSLVVPALQDAGGYAISRQNNLELYLGSHSCWLSYLTLARLWWGRTDGRTYGHVITKIFRMGRLPNFLRYGATLASARVGLNFLLGLPKRQKK